MFEFIDFSRQSPGHRTHLSGFSDDLLEISLGLRRISLSELNLMYILGGMSFCNINKMYEVIRTFKSTAFRSSHTPVSRFINIPINAGL